MFLFNLLRDAYARITTTYQTHSSTLLLLFFGCFAQNIFRNSRQFREHEPDAGSEKNIWINTTYINESTHLRILNVLNSSGNHFGAIFFFRYSAVVIYYTSWYYFVYTQPKSIMKTYFHFIWKAKEKTLH